MNDKLAQFAAILEADLVTELHRRDVACDANIAHCKVRVSVGPKYTQVNTGMKGMKTAPASFSASRALVGSTGYAIGATWTPLRVFIGATGRIRHGWRNLGFPARRANVMPRLLESKRRRTVSEDRPL